MQKQLRAPASGALRAAFLRFFARERGGHGARNRGFGLASYSRGLVFLRGHYRRKEPRTGVPRGGHCRPKCPTRLPTGWHRRCWTRLRNLGFRLAFCSRGLVLPQGDTTSPRSRGLVFPEEDIEDPQISNGVIDGLAPSFLVIFRGQLEGILAFFLPTSEERPDARNHGSDSRRVPNVSFSRTGTLQAQNPTRRLTLLSNTPQTKCIFWQPPSHVSPWFPSSFATDDVPYTCAEQYMMAEKTRLFQNHRAVGLIMSSPSPNTRKRIGRGVRNIDSGAGDR